MTRRRFHVNFIASGCLAVALFSFGGATANATPIPDSMSQATILATQYALYNDDYDQADSLTFWLRAVQPEQPLGYLFGAVSLMVRMAAVEERIREIEFHILLDSTEALCDRQLPSADDRSAAWLCLAHGHAEAYRSLWEAKFGSKTSALKLGLSARDWYERGLSYDSSLADLYFGLGLYHYWKSVRAGLFRWVGIFSDDRQQGVRELLIAADSSVISREAARNSLIWVWLEEGQYDSTIALGQAFLERYPDGVSVLWPIGEAYFAQNNYHLALETYRRLRQALAREPGNYINLIECDHWIWRCYDRLGLSEQAREVARRVRDYEIDVPNDTRRALRDKIAHLKRAARL